MLIHHSTTAARARRARSPLRKPIQHSARVKGRCARWVLTIGAARERMQNSLRPTPTHHSRRHELKQRTAALSKAPGPTALLGRPIENAAWRQNQITHGIEAVVPSLKGVKDCLYPRAAWRAWRRKRKYSPTADFGCAAGPAAKIRCSIKGAVSSRDQPFGVRAVAATVKSVDILESSCCAGRHRRRERKGRTAP
jgi:hypothetical protein